MTLGLLGRKIGMTQVFGKDGTLIPVTVVQLGPCTVIQKKSKEKDGYQAIQLGFGKVSKKERLTKPRRGHFEKKKCDYFKTLQ